jgi:hypothetical protein
VGGGAEAGPGKTPVGVGAVVGWSGFVGGRKSMPCSKKPLGGGLGFPDGDAMGGGGYLLWGRERNGGALECQGGSPQEEEESGFSRLVLVFCSFN